VNLFEWSRARRPADAVDLCRPGALSSLLDTYGGANPQVLQAVLGQAFTLGAQTAVVEYRYLDADYRNEHSRFYSTTFRRYASAAHRLHFLATPIPPELSSPDRPARFHQPGYLGYTVLRPVPAAPVGRTMLAPPPDLAPHVTCTASDQINLLGEPLAVTAAPFIAQDAQLSKCAQAALWVTAYYHHLAHGTPRLLPGDIAAAVPAELALSRPVPAEGLSVFQLSAAATRIGLPALVYRLDDLPPGESLPRIACRYLNSGLPVITAGAGHAFVLVGYRRVQPGTPQERIHFIRQDDEVGPYQVVENFLLDDYSPWQYLIVPLPAKVYLSGEKAEVLGQARLATSAADSASPAARQLHAAIVAHQVSFRSTVLKSNSFKTGLERRGVADPVASIYRRMPMSHWIWVVEAIDRTARDRGDPCVLAEAIIDATDHLRDLHVLAWRIPGQLVQWDPDEDRLRRRDLAAVPPLDSVACGTG
jgi:hypothetical protein